MQEFFPLLLGLIFGVASDVDRRLLRSVRTRTSLLLTCGIAATLVSGEYRESGWFTLVDCGEVAFTAWIGTALSARLRRYLSDGSRIRIASKL